MLDRRTFCQGEVLASGALAVTSVNLAQAAAALARVGEPLTEVAHLDWLCNAVALTSTGRLFVGLPRWPGFENTPSIADGTA